MEMDARTHILVIEDDSSLRELYQRVLESEGYIVSTASDGFEGLEKFDSASTGLILLDLMMPRMNGWEALERVRRVSNCPVIIVTGQDVEEDIVRGLLEAGADGYLVKPVEIQELLIRITAVLRRSAPASQ